MELTLQMQDAWSQLFTLSPGLCIYSSALKEPKVSLISSLASKWFLMLLWRVDLGWLPDKNPSAPFTSLFNRTWGENKKEKHMDWDRGREITYKLLSKHTQHRKKYFTLMLSWVVRNKQTPFSPSCPFFPQTQFHYFIPNSPTSPFPKQQGRNGGLLGNVDRQKVSLQHCLSSSFLLKLFLCSSVRTLCGLQFLAWEPALLWALHSCSVQAVPISSSMGSFMGCSVDICSDVVLCRDCRELPAPLWFLPKHPWAAAEYLLWCLEHLLSLLYWLWCSWEWHIFFPPMLFVFLDKFSKRCPKLCWSGQLSCSGSVTVPGTEAHLGSFSQGPSVQPPSTKALPPVLSTATQHSCIIIYDLNTLILPTNSNTPTTFWRIRLLVWSSWKEKDWITAFYFCKQTPPRTRSNAQTFCHILGMPLELIADLAKFNTDP